MLQDLHVLMYLKYIFYDEFFQPIYLTKKLFIIPAQCKCTPSLQASYIFCLYKIFALHSLILLSDHVPSLIHIQHSVAAVPGSRKLIEPCIVHNVSPDRKNKCK